MMLTGKIMNFTEIMHLQPKTICREPATGKVSRDGILPELSPYRLPGRFSVRPALRTQGEKGSGHSPQLNSFF